MKHAPPSEIWGRLRESGIVAGECPGDGETQSPWYVRAMLGITGWIAAAFLLGFVGLGLAVVVKSHVTSIAVGLMVIAGAYTIFRTAGTNDFASQFGIAVSFAGQTLVAFGLFRLFEYRHGTSAWFTIAVLQAGLAVLLPNFVHRVWSAYASAAALSMGLALLGAYFLSSGLLAAAVAMVWLNEFEWPEFGSLVQPVGYGLTFALVQVEGTSHFGRSAFHLVGLHDPVAVWAKPWMGAALTIIVLLVVVWLLLDRSRERLSGRNGLVTLFSAAAIGAATFRAPGIATGLMIVVLGHANGNRILVGLGIAALLCYVSAYYYLLEATLLVKSQVLAAVGGVLLAARWILASRFFQEEESSRA